MNDLKRNITPDDILLMNTVCKGMPLDFTTLFMKRIPSLLGVVDSLNWTHDRLPEVTAGECRYFNVVLIGVDGNKRVVGSVGYLNRYELNIEDPEDREGVEVFVEDDDCITTFYTGWAFSEHDSYQDIVTWDFIQSQCVVAWKELPTYNELKAG